MKKTVTIKKLSPQEQTLWETLNGKGEQTFERIIFAVWEKPKKIVRLSPRLQQQKIGCLATRINRKRPGSRIEPGEARHTYKLRRNRADRRNLQDARTS